MKVIQFLMSTVAMLLLCSLVTVAQPGQGRGQAQQGQRGQVMSPEQRKAQMEKLAADLEMDEEQKAGYFKLEEEFTAKTQALRAENQGDFSAMRGSMMQLRQERQDAIMALLNEEQQARYEKILADRQNMRGQWGQNRAQQAQEDNQPSKKKEKKAKKGGGGK
jgi:hypothetical protein